MSETKLTPAMPSSDDPKKGAADGVNSQGEGDTGKGGSEGAAYPNPHTGKSKEDRSGFADGPLSHGGQSDNAYHGTGQLGSRKTRPGGNPNAGARED